MERLQKHYERNNESLPVPERPFRLASIMGWAWLLSRAGLSYTTDLL
jgi:hypothetical protein